jgi:hypothetical protein
MTAVKLQALVSSGPRGSDAVGIHSSEKKKDPLFSHKAMLSDSQQSGRVAKQS